MIAQFFRVSKWCEGFLEEMHICSKEGQETNVDKIGRLLFRSRKEVEKFISLWHNCLNKVLIHSNGLKKEGRYELGTAEPLNISPHISNNSI